MRSRGGTDDGRPSMKPPPSKPQGSSGPIQVGAGGAVWKVIPFPEGKAEREELIAKLFVAAFDHYVAMQSEPSFAPFGQPIQNDENHLDFTVATSQGQKLMELAEFAPLHAYGPKFENAPKELHPKSKADLAFDLIAAKSAHQGGKDRFLVIYVTEQGFWLDPISVERIRRKAHTSPPNFDRVYYLSPHDLTSASATEIWPGTPHHWFGEYTDEQLDQMGVQMPHPLDMEVVREITGTMPVRSGGQIITANLTINLSNFGPIRRGQ